MRDTSLEAYDQLKPKLGKRQNIIYEAIRRHPDLTAAEIAYVLGHSDPNYARPRIHELEATGLVVSSGRRACTRSKVAAHTWKVKP